LRRQRRKRLRLKLPFVQPVTGTKVALACVDRRLSGSRTITVTDIEGEYKSALRRSDSKIMSRLLTCNFQERLKKGDKEGEEVVQEGKHQDNTKGRERKGWKCWQQPTACKKTLALHPQEKAQKQTSQLKMGFSAGRKAKPACPGDKETEPVTWLTKRRTVST